MSTKKGFIKNLSGDKILPITRGELVLDKDGKIALTSEYFEAGVNKNDYGLISAKDLAKLKGNGSGQSLGDIYNKLSYINGGIKVGESVLNFYNTDNNTITQTPIVFAGDGTGITVTTAAENTIKIALKELTTPVQPIKGGLVRDITVDAYGRVTAVGSGTLSDDDIPTNLSDKVLSGCTVTTDPEQNFSIVNKQYVDTAINRVTGIATGSLKFGGTVGKQSTNLSDLLVESNDYKYYKVSETLENISTALLYDSAGLPIINSTVTLKPGDTLIVYPVTPTERKFMVVPSADDHTVHIHYGANVQANNITSPLNVYFAEYFANVQQTEGVKIELNRADSTHSGYLHKDDFARFDTYVSTTHVQYAGEPSVTDSTRKYKLGTLTLDQTPYEIYGLQYNSSLSLYTEGDTVGLNFEENGVSTKIPVKGQGLTVNTETADGVTSLKLGVHLTTDTGKYLEASGNKVNAKLATFKVEEGEIKSTDGLVNVATATDIALTYVNAAQSASYEYIDNSLSNTDSTYDYYYGSEQLRLAVGIDI